MSTLYHSDAFQMWMRSVLAPEVGAITGEDIYATLIRIFEQLSQKGMVLALDFSKAFDCLDARVTTAMLQKYGWPPGLLKIFELVWLRLDRFIQFQQHTHSVPLNGVCSPKETPWVPWSCRFGSRLVLKFVQHHAQAPARTVMYIDDRTITGNSAPVLASHQASWASWSDQTGLLENAAKTEATGASARLQQDLGTCFQPREIKKHVKLLGACTYCNPRSHTGAEAQRLSSAKERLRLLGCAGFGLDRYLREAKSFAMSKANFGWIARAPTLGACKQLWSCLWRAAARVHYSSPWVRALIWTNCHLDVLWATRLVGGLLRRAAKEAVQWTLHRGTACCALHEWLLQKGLGVSR